jgi:hypothetical protein
MRLALPPKRVMSARTFAGFVARVERSETRGIAAVPDFASLHPGYGPAKVATQVASNSLVVARGGVGMSLNPSRGRIGIDRGRALRPSLFAGPLWLAPRMQYKLKTLGRATRSVERPQYPTPDFAPQLSAVVKCREVFLLADRY